MIAASALALMFNLFYNYNGGLFNSILTVFGFEPVLWITEKTSLFLVMAPAIWQYVGFYFVIILTALTKIPNSYYEVAALEGANLFERITKITIPLIFQDIRVFMVLAITGVLKVFDFVWIITQGGPFDSSQVLGTYLYDTVFQRRLYGYGSAIAVLIIVFGFIITFVARRLSKTEEVIIS